MILYLEDSKLHQKTTKANKFNKVAGCKIKIEINTYLYINNESADKDTRKTFSFIIASKKKYRRINLTRR